MQKTIRLILILSLLFLTACNRALESVEYQVIDAATEQTVNAIALTSGEDFSFYVTLPDDPLKNGNIQITSEGDDLALTCTDGVVTLCGQGETSGSILLTLTADNIPAPLVYVVEWNCALKPQTVALSTAPTELQDAEDAVDDTTPLSEELIAVATLYEGTKEILLARLTAGEALTTADLIDTVSTGSVEDGTIYLIAGYGTQFQFVTPEGATTTVTVENDEITVTQEGDIYIVTSTTAGSATITLTTEQEHYETVVTEIPVYISAPPALIIPAKESAELEIDTSTNYKYYVYPADAEVSVSSKDETIATAALSTDGFTISAIALGDTEIALTATCSEFDPAEILFATTVTPTKIALSLSGSGLSDGKLSVYLTSPKSISYSSLSDATITLDYPTDALTIEDTGSALNITANTEGTFVLSVTASHADYYDNTQQITITASKEPVDFSLQTSSITINDVESPQTVALYSNTPNVSYSITASDGITATLNGSTLSISGAQDGTVSITASSEGYQSTTLTLSATYQAPTVAFYCSTAALALVAQSVENPPSTSFTITTTNVSNPTVEVKVEGNGSATYSATSDTSGTVTVTGSEALKVYISVSKDGYTTSTEMLGASYKAPSLSLSVSNTNISLEEASPSTTVSVSTGSVSGVSIAVSASSGITASYANGTLSITASESGQIYLTATKDGYESAQSTINVTYTKTVVQSSVSSSYAAEVFRLINIEREANGLAPFTQYSTLTAAAQLRASELVTYYSHTRPDGSSCFTAYADVGLTNYGWAAENIASGYTSAADVVNGWMNSEGHRANILNENLNSIGIGVAADANGTLYWVQMFTD